MTTPATPSRRTLVWCHTEHEELVREVVEIAALDLAGIGSPDSGAATALAEAFGAPRCADLRQAAFTQEHDLLWLLTVEGVDAEDLATLLERSPLAVSAEPIPDGLSRLPADGEPTARLVPAMRDGQSMRLFDELRDDFGPIRSVSVIARGRAAHGSLYARLVDAVDTVERLCGPIELIDAALSGPLTEPPDSLRDLHGHLTANARFALNCCAALHVSDRGGSWFRGVTILGDGGCVRMTDTGLDWFDPDGKRVESATFDDEPHSPRLAGGKRTPAETASGRSAAPPRQAGGYVLPASLIAAEVSSLLDPRRPARQPHPSARTLAACEAIRLSIRTGQPETPRKMLEVMNR